MLFALLVFFISRFSSRHSFYSPFTPPCCSALPTRSRHFQTHSHASMALALMQTLGSASQESLVGVRNSFHCSSVWSQSVWYSCTPAPYPAFPHPSATFPHCGIAYNSYTARIDFTAPVGFTNFSQALIAHVGITAWCSSVLMVIRWLGTSSRVYTSVVCSDIQFSFPSWACEHLRCEHAAVAAHPNSAAVPRPPGTAQPHSCHTTYKYKSLYGASN